MFSGSGSEHEVAAPAVQAASGPAPVGAYQDQQASGPCAWEIKQFLQCAQQQDDLSLCSGFNEAIRQCKEVNREYLHNNILLGLKSSKYTGISSFSLGMA